MIVLHFLDPTTVKIETKRHSWRHKFCFFLTEAESKCGTSTHAVFSRLSICFRTPSLWWELTSWLQKSEFARLHSFIFNNHVQALYCRLGMLYACFIYMLDSKSPLQVALWLSLTFVLWCICVNVGTSSYHRINIELMSSSIADKTACLSFFDLTELPSHGNKTMIFFIYLFMLTEKKITKNSLGDVSDWNMCWMGTCLHTNTDLAVANLICHCDRHGCTNLNRANI